MANKKMGFEGILLSGTAGSTGTNQLTNTRDITVTMDVERGDTTVRGDSTKPPIKTADVTSRIVGIEFVMVNDITDANFAALMAAAALGGAVSLRGKDYAAGKGPDADFTLSVSRPWPLAGEQVVTFTGEPSNSYGREPENYV